MEPGPGMLLQLQRNEFVRASRMVGRRADLWVLSGTGTMFRVPVLRQVARLIPVRRKQVPGYRRRVPVAGAQTIARHRTRHGDNP